MGKLLRLACGLVSAVALITSVVVAGTAQAGTSQDSVVTALPSARTPHILDASSHHLQEERPEHYFHIVRAFLDQPEPT